MLNSSVSLFMIDASSNEIFNFYNCFDKIKRLPSAVAIYVPKKDVYNYDKDSDAYKLYTAAKEAYVNWLQAGDPSKSYTIDLMFQSSVREYGKLGNVIMQSLTLANYCQTCLSRSNYGLGVEVLLRAIALNKCGDKFDLLYGILYKQLVATTDHLIAVKKEYIERGDNYSASSLMGLISQSRRQLIDLYGGIAGRKAIANAEAYRVEQGEVGYSAKELIGTDNINNCMCVMIWNPGTKKLALAHMDKYTNIDSLQEIINKLYTGNKLQVKLVGARAQNDRNYIKTVVYNFNRIISYLNSYSVEIVNVNLLKNDQPVNVVVNPENFEVYEQIPLKSNEDQYLRQGMIYISKTDKNLKTAFDFTLNLNHIPIMLHKKEVKVLRNQFLKYDEEDLYKKDLVATPICGRTHANVELLLILQDEYYQAIDKIEAAVENKIQNLLSNGFESPPEIKSSIINVISKRSVYIGKDADIFNLPLVKYIEEKLFNFDFMGKIYSDISGLKNFQLPNSYIAKVWSKPVDNHMNID